MMQPPVHPFAATLELMLEGGFANLNEQQRWEWHADVYAYNEVMLSRKDSPVDRKRRWFDAARVEIAARYYRARLASGDAKHRTRDSALQGEGRALINRWAKRHGFETIDTFAEARSIDTITAITMAGRDLVLERAKQEAQREGFEAVVAADRDATGREYTPIAMAAARRELGIPEPNPEEQAA